MTLYLWLSPLAIFDLRVGLGPAVSFSRIVLNIKLIQWDEGEGKIDLSMKAQ